MNRRQLLSILIATTGGCIRLTQSNTTTTGETPGGSATGESTLNDMSGRTENDTASPKTGDDEGRVTGTGRASHASASSEAKEVWSVNRGGTKGNIIGNINQNKVSIASNESGLKTYDIQRNETLWTLNNETHEWLQPKFHAGEIFIAGENGTASQNRSKIYRLNGESGNVRAKRDLEGRISGSIAVNDNIVILGAVQSNEHEHSIYVLDRDTLRSQWVDKVESKANYDGSIVLNGTIHAVFGNFIIGYNLEDGSQKYRVPWTANRPIRHNNDLIMAADSKLRRIEPESLSFKWKVGNEVFGVPVISNGITAAQTTNGVLAATVDQGEMLWKRELETSSSYYSDTLAFHGGILWSIAADNVLRGHAPLSGKIAFEFPERKSWWIASGRKGVLVGHNNQTRIYSIKET